MAKMNVGPSIRGRKQRQYYTLTTTKPLAKADKVVGVDLILRDAEKILIVSYGGPMSDFDPIVATGGRCHNVEVKYPDGSVAVPLIGQAAMVINGNTAEFTFY
jgi:hypothetical protein